MSLPSVFVLGDSISIHYGPYLKKYLEGFFRYERKKGNGGDSGAVLSYLLASREQHKLLAKYLLLNCGLHDIKSDPTTGHKHISKKQYQRNLEHIISTARRFYPNVVWVRSTPVNEKRHNTTDSAVYRFNQDVIAYNTIADKVMKKNRIPIIDLYAYTKSLGGDLYVDHAHFSHIVRRKQAQYIADYLKSLLRQNALGKNTKPPLTGGVAV